MTNGSRPARILVVDDEEHITELVAMGLGYNGFEVERVGSGRAALDAIGRHRPDLIVLDVMLPDLDGFEVARRLAAGEQRPVIVLTSTREASDYGGRIAASPAAGFLPKDQLSGAALRRFLGGDRA